MFLLPQRKTRKKTLSNMEKVMEKEKKNFKLKVGVNVAMVD
jgi:hypothetical protein